MRFPPSRRNKYSSYYNEQNMVDYNIMAPLNTPGYSFPCKGYRKGPITHTFDSNIITISLEGTVTHGGGHCQFGISFDDSTFIVLKTVIRDCLLNGLDFQVDLPDNLPSNEFTLFWTWVNAIGNREYYMECADVSIKQNVRGSVSGKELVVVNLPGYQIVPEFSQSGMYDGRELILQAKNIQYPYKYHHRLAPQFPRIVTQQRQERLLEQEHQHERSDRCEPNGFIKCSSTGFSTCDHNNWVYRDCARGTSCKPFGNSIICDYDYSN